MKQKQPLSWQQGLTILTVIWLIGALGDRLWFSLDNSVPDWDSADYLNGVLNYANALQTPQWLNAEWWREFWLLSNKIPPFHYILSVPFFDFGNSQDAATIVMLVYSGILLVSVYGLAVVLFNPTLGLWAAGLCQLIPGLYYYRLEFLLDYPLAAMVTLSYAALTVWKFKKGTVTAILFGVSFGLAILLKQTALFFLFFPILWLLVACLKNRQWWRLTQLIGSILVGVAIAFPWYRTNWLLILTSGKRATVDSAIAEGDPALSTLDAWTYYAKVLPYLLSWHLLIIPIAGFIFYAIRKYSRHNKTLPISPSPHLPISLSPHLPISLSPHFPISSTHKWRWLTVFLLGGYLLSSLNINKDARYILPLLPVLSLILAAGLLCWTRRWQHYIRWGTVGLAIILALLNLFPLGGNYLTAKLSPRVSHHPYTGKPYPHPEVIREIIDTSPYLRSTLGVLPSTPDINQHNFSFYGGLKDFQVFGRQVGVREDEVIADARSLDWFITKTGDQGSIPDSQPAIVSIVESGGDFDLHQSWQLPDNSSLKLYHRKLPLVEVNKTTTGLSNNKFSLQNISLPKTSLPGVPIPVTYEWSGNWADLQAGIVLLTWENSANFWLHDHSIGMGALDSSKEIDPNSIFQVIERTAMLTPNTIAEGEYTLKATYLNRNTGQTYPLDIPPVTINIAYNATDKPAPELDLVTQLRAIAPQMANSIKGLEPIFAQTARINQYDGRQDYLRQTELALSYRLQHDDVSPQKKLDWLYAVALSQVLQQDVDGAIASFNKITELEPQNSYGYAYLAFVYLYNWQPQAATMKLNIAAKIDSNIPEVQTLQGIAALMQGNLVKAWRFLK